MRSRSYLTFGVFKSHAAVPTMNCMVYVLMFGFMGLYLFGLWRHFGLTWALIYAGVGLFIVVPTVGYLVAGLIEGPDASWVRGWGLFGFLWAFFFVLLAFLTRPLQPTPAPREKVEEHRDMIDTWATAGFTEWAAWLLRPGGRGVLFAFGKPMGHTVFVAFVEGPRSKTVAMSSLVRIQPCHLRARQSSYLRLTYIQNQRQSRE